MKIKIGILSFVLFSFLSSILLGNDIAQYLQDISVTIKSDRSEGSGVIITREIKKNKDSEDKETINFVWTAGHVVDGLKSTREVIDPNNGQKRNVIEFKDAQIVKELNENGRKIGELKMDAKILKFSDANNGEDLALLMVRKRNFVTASARFYLGQEIIPIGTRLNHVGSLLGQAGANSMTSGIMSQIGRVLQLGSGDGTVFDQCQVGAFPGSSGGGVFIGDGDHNGEYVGMLVRGAGEGFNLIVPVRRMSAWAKSQNVYWAIDANSEAPTLDAINGMTIEDPGFKFMDDRDKKNSEATDNKKFPILIERTEKENKVNILDDLPSTLSL